MSLKWTPVQTEHEDIDALAGQADGGGGLGSEAGDSLEWGGQRQLIAGQKQLIEAQGDNGYRVGR